MIFVTVGHQMPFDRLIRAMDEWAGRAGRRDVVAQIGDAGYRPQNMQFVKSMPPEAFIDHLRRSSAVVGHAGTGTILAALQLGKPLLVLPRLSRLGETRNDHQVPTARHFAQAGYVLAATDEVDLVAKVQEIETFQPRASIESVASAELLERLRRFVRSELGPARNAVPV